MDKNEELKKIADYYDNRAKKLELQGNGAQRN